MPAPMPLPLPLLRRAAELPARQLAAPRCALSRPPRALPGPSAGASLCAGRERPLSPGASPAAARWARAGARAGTHTGRLGEGAGVVP